MAGEGEVESVQNRRLLVLLVAGPSILQVLLFESCY
jgi:hypothetical protein